MEVHGAHVEMGEGYGNLDHRFIVLRGQSTFSDPRPFRFELVCLEKEGIIALMQQWWEIFNIEGNLGFILSEKLEHLKGKLQIWAKDNFGMVESRIIRWETTISKFESAEENYGLSGDECNKKREAELKLHEALGDEMSFWSQRAKRMWHKKGDKCTTFFHKVVNSRQIRNSAQGIVINGYVEQDVGNVMIT